MLTWILRKLNCAVGNHEWRPRHHSDGTRGWFTYECVHCGDDDQLEP